METKVVCGEEVLLQFDEVRLAKLVGRMSHPTCVYTVPTIDVECIALDQELIQCPGSGNPVFGANPVEDLKLGLGPRITLDSVLDLVTTSVEGSARVGVG